MIDSAAYYNKKASRVLNILGGQIGGGGGGRGEGGMLRFSQFGFGKFYSTASALLASTDEC